jgi:hypothetical protein
MIRLGYVPVGIECHRPFFDELEHQTMKLYWRMFENDIVKFV